ncbi:MAG: selenium cofactor biosynthesis protein YqeC [Myxococcota bacterium]
MDAEPALVLSAVADLPGAAHVTVAARALPEGKLKGFGAADIATFRDAGAFDWILVGAARRPLEAPADHEPVVPPDTTIHVAVIGLDVIGAALDDDLVFRADLAGPRMGLAPGDRITEEALVRLASHPLGLFKGAPPGADRLIFADKADTPTRRASGERFAGLLRAMEAPPADRVVVGQALERLRVPSTDRLEGRA